MVYNYLYTRYIKFSVYIFVYMFGCILAMRNGRTNHNGILEAYNTYFNLALGRVQEGHIVLEIKAYPCLTLYYVFIPSWQIFIFLHCQHSIVYSNQLNVSPPVECSINGSSW